MKVIVDIVPNHTSIGMLVCRRTRSRSGLPERDRYIFRDGSGPDGSDLRATGIAVRWIAGRRSVTVSSTSTVSPHEQPDLNWENEDVRADFRTTVRFWSDRGVDGFRIDVAHGLRKNMSEPYAPWGEIAEMKRSDGSHPLWDRDDVQEIYAEWRTIFDAYDPPRFAVAEASVHPTRRHVTPRRPVSARPSTSPCRMRTSARRTIGR